MGLSHRQNLTMGLGMLVLFTLTGAATYQLTRPKSIGQPVPVLNDMQVCAWLSDDVAFVQHTSEPPDVLIANLHTGTLSRLPTPPPVPHETRRGDGYTENYMRSERGISPDGKWLLYQESHVWGWEDSGGPLGTRWRLLRTSDGTSRFWPADGSFIPVPNQSRYGQMQARVLRWLPDNSGWVEFKQLSSGECSLQHYDLPSQAPRALKAPSLKPGFSLRQFLPNGQAVFAHQTEFELVPLFPGAPPGAHHKLALPPDRGSYSFLAYTPEALLVSSYYTIERKGLVRWIASRLRMEDGFCAIWRIPLRGGAPQKLTTLPHDAHNFTLTHDQKRLLYWEPNGEAIGAYALALP